MSAPAPRSAILDTNVFLLFLVGQTTPRLLLTWKRVNTFSQADIDLLNDELRSYKELRTTPHILTEASDFIDQAPRHNRADPVHAVKLFVQKRFEQYEKASELCSRKEFEHLALTDTGLVSLSVSAVMITTDFELSNRIASAGGHAINFNNLRSAQLIPNRAKPNLSHA